MNGNVQVDQQQAQETNGIQQLVAMNQEKDAKIKEEKQKVAKLIKKYGILKRNQKKTIVHLVKKLAKKSEELR